MRRGVPKEKDRNKDTKISAARIPATAEKQEEEASRIARLSCSKRMSFLERPRANSVFPSRALSAVDSDKVRRNKNALESKEMREKKSKTTPI